MANPADTEGLVVDLPTCPSCGETLLGLSRGIEIPRGIVVKFARQCPYCRIPLLCEAARTVLVTVKRDYTEADATRRNGRH